MIRIGPSTPVVSCVVFSAASACNAANVFARKAGTVHDSAPVKTVERKNSRLVCIVISSFINLPVTPLSLAAHDLRILLRQLILWSAHYQSNGIQYSRIVNRIARIQVLAQGLLLFRFQLVLDQPPFKARNERCFTFALR